MTTEPEALAIHALLHDSVLPTLVAIARGHLRPDDDRVRRRCASDASHIRRLIDRTADAAADGDLARALARVMDRMEAVGLHVSLLTDCAGSGVPAAAVEALSFATLEALNNVYEHAGVDCAWVTAALEDGVTVVRVVDRGAGFDPAAAATAAGLGLRRSIAERVRRVGGHASVRSRPGEGTCVELRWPG